VVDKETLTEIPESENSVVFSDIKRITLPPMAWYGGSWAYSEPEPESESEPEIPLPAAANSLPSKTELSDFGLFRRPGESTGVILGRFLPPHAGHQYLLEFARAFAKKLTIFLHVGKEPVIPGELRENWLRELFPDAQIQRIDFSPTLEDLTDEKVRTNWVQLVLKIVPRPDYLFTAESYGADLAAKLGAIHIPVDQHRRIVPISSTQIRANPIAHWEHLPPAVRAFYTKKVCLIGPEESGKSTLAWRLAAHYNTLYTEEFARAYLVNQGLKWQPETTQTIVNGQLASEAVLARRANRILFCDTDVLSVHLWCERQFGISPSWLTEAAKLQVHDLYLVTSPERPAPAQQQNDHEKERQHFYERCLVEIKAKNGQFAILTGDGDSRFRQACVAVDSLLAKAFS
jgi:HTH-type transcriptional regulator, transcriptional repressor of NAD biosynthesis genes